MQRRLLILAALGVAMWLQSGTTAQAQTRIRLQASLTPTAQQALASGKAKYEERGTRRKFSCEVEDLRGVSRINVTLGARLLGTRPVVGGIADLNLDTIRGNTVPRMRVNALIRVYDADTGALLMSGRLR
ncbi:MAG: hypothetical protein R3E01_26920 [Pirellulaceae bacterium]|nr:hypothetical protein [Planctomycetales bacterium]